MFGDALACEAGAGAELADGESGFAGEAIKEGKAGGVAESGEEEGKLSSSLGHRLRCFQLGCPSLGCCREGLRDGAGRGGNRNRFR